MNSTNSYIMRDQAENVVNDFMQYEQNIPVFEFLSQLSIAVMAVFTFR